VFFFFDLVTRDADDMIVFQRQLHGFVECDTPRRYWFAFLCGECTGVKNQRDSAKEREA